MLLVLIAMIMDSGASDNENYSGKPILQCYLFTYAVYSAVFLICKLINLFVTNHNL